MNRDRGWWRARTAVVCLLAGCGGTSAFRPLDPAALKGSAPRTIVVAVSEPPPFVLAPETRMVLAGGGPIGAAIVGTVVAQREAGRRETLRAAGIEDPAAMARPAIVGALAQRLGLQELHPGVTAATKPAAIAKDYPGGDLIVDVRTLKWGLLATRSGRYWLDYVGTLRLIDGRNGSVLAEGSCSNPPPRNDDGELPVYLAYAFDNGAALKRDLQAIANRCSDDYLTRVLRLQVEVSGQPKT